MPAEESAVDGRQNTQFLIAHLDAMSADENCECHEKVIALFLSDFFLYVHRVGN